ncbi:MAG: methenyltetrahydromethanopterin cyclohydrolase [Gemmataceae bacterium]
MTLNERAVRAADELAADATGLRIAAGSVGGARVLDCGVKAVGGLRAGLGLARVCLAGLGDVALLPGDSASLNLPRIQVSSDQPLLACLASQYAGWQISVGKYFAMGSGPMRVAYGKEQLFDDIPGRERPPVAAGVLETGKLPTEEVVAYIAERVNLPARQLTLLAAKTASLAGGVQVVARSLELALHKLHELKFDLNQIISGVGVAPLPPPAADDFAAMGRTNDAILYGGRVTLWVSADDSALEEIGPKVPSNSSAEYGALFGELFAKYKDFYKIDPLLFSPAEIAFCNARSGRTFAFGKMVPEALRRSFGI